MSSGARLTGVLLAMIALTIAALVQAQVADRPPQVFIDSDKVSSDTPAPPLAFEQLLLPADRLAQKRIDTALDYIKVESWPEAIRLLQALLDAPEDLFLQQERRETGGRTTVRWLSARAEAERLIGALPAPGREFYEVHTGRLAADRLKEARTRNDPHLLAEIARRYLFTQAGVEALALLATHHLDRGRADLAAECFKRLQKRAALKELAPLALFQSAIAFRQTGDRDRAEAAWQQLAARSPNGLRVGKQVVALDRLRREVDRLPVLGADVAGGARNTGWPMFRGGPARLGQGAGEIPYLEPRWHTNTFERSETRRPIDLALKYLESAQEPALPTFFPITTGSRVIFRSHAGVHCIDMRTGKEVWKSAAPLSFEGILRDPGRKVQLDQWMRMYGANGLVSGINLGGVGIGGGRWGPGFGGAFGFGGGPGMPVPAAPAGPSGVNAAAGLLLFSNCALGTLSTDQRRVYAVEDLPLPPPPELFQQSEGGAPPRFGPMRDPVYHSRLRAIDLETGKLAWELGGRGNGELHDAFFLGPPLPLAGQLYALIDRNSELRLLCLKPEHGEVVWSQVLASYRDKVLYDARRRIQAAHLSHADGVLVCSTNAGVLLGVDVLTRSLLWAHTYRGKGQPGQDDGQLPVPIDSLTAVWRTAPPIIHGGKVVFTAPDGDAVHCLNLRDGTLLWKASRTDDDLYLAGVFRDRVLLVGKHTCRALALLDGGKQVWQLETGLPSGQGVAGGPLYYLPLQRGAVLALDVVKGSVAARTESRGGEVPGNLLFHDDLLLSQTAVGLAAYPLLQVQLARVNEQLAKDPRDPVALTERGALRLDQGDLAGAVTDLRAARANGPPIDLLPRTHAKLYEALTQQLQRDFAIGEQYLDEYRELCLVAIPEHATVEQRGKLREERERRLTHFQALLARGRERQGRLAEALQAYQQLFDRGAVGPPLAALDDPAARVRPDLWVQTQVAALVEQAGPEPRRAFEVLIGRERRQAADVPALERFVGVFGAVPAAGPAARLELAERLTEDHDHGRFLEAELHLLQLLDREKDPVLAGRAAEALARLLLRKGLPEDAMHFYRLLGREFAQVVLREGKTGADLLDELAGDKRLLVQVHEGAPAWVPGRIKASEEPAGTPAKPNHLVFEPKGELLPFFQRHRLVLDLTSSQLRLLDVATAVPVWSQKVALGTVRNHLQEAAQEGLRIPCAVVGHLAVLNLGHLVCALDLIDRRILWQRRLFDGPVSADQLAFQFDPRVGWAPGLPDGSATFAWLARVGPSAICVQTARGLVALEPLRGDFLWARTDQTTATEFFSDTGHLYLVQPGTGLTRALRGRDGVAVPAPAFADSYQQRVAVVGGQLLVFDSDPASGAPRLRLYDVRTGSDVWKRALPNGAGVLHSSDPGLTGAIDPEGKVTILEMTSGKELLRVNVEAEQLRKAQRINLLADRTHFYLAIQEPLDPAGGIAGEPEPNFAGGQGSVPVNGMLHAFDRATGRLIWRNRLTCQQLVIDRFEELPVVICTARFVRQAGANGDAVLVTATRTFDKKTGKLLYNKEIAMPEGPVPAATLFHTLQLDPRAGTIDLVSARIRIRHGPAPAK